MLKAYKFRLKVNKSEHDMLSQHVGCSRFFYNYYLNEKIEYYKFNNKSLNTNDCIKDLVNLKYVYPWLRNVDSTSLQQSLRNLDTAYKNFFKHGRGFPKFKSKHRSKRSFRIVNVNDNIRFSNTKLKIGKLGFLRIFKASKRLSRLPDVYTIKSCTISQDSDQHWYVSILLECENQAFLESNTNIVGIDLGIRNNYTLYYNNVSDFYTQHIDNPKSYQKLERKIAKLNKQLSKKVKGSKNRDKARIKLAKVYFQIKNVRRDFNHQLSKNLINNFQMIVIEDLDIESMKVKLGKEISDLAFHQFRTFLTYKASWYGRHLNIVNRYFSSSKLCSNCKTKNINLKLSDKIWVCPVCQCSHDRDLNASYNLWNAGFVTWHTGNYNIQDSDYISYFSTAGTAGIHASGDI